MYTSLATSKMMPGELSRDRCRRHYLPTHKKYPHFNVCFASELFMLYLMMNLWLWSAATLWLPSSSSHSGSISELCRPLSLRRILKLRVSLLCTTSLCIPLRPNEVSALRYTLKHNKSAKVFANSMSAGSPLYGATRGFQEESQLKAHLPR